MTGAYAVERGTIWIALTGQKSFWEPTEGVALGYDGAGRWAVKFRTSLPRPPWGGELAGQLSEGLAPRLQSRGPLHS
jgi:hypothetical protein